MEKSQCKNWDGGTIGTPRQCHRVQDRLFTSTNTNIGDLVQNAAVELKKWPTINKKLLFGM